MTTRIRLKSHATGSVEPLRLAQSHFTALLLHSFVSALKSVERVKGIEPSFQMRLTNEARVGFHLSPKMWEFA
jgi:hypothetical protein